VLITAVATEEAGRRLRALRATTAPGLDVISQVERHAAHALWRGSSRGPGHATLWTAGGPERQAGAPAASSARGPDRDAAAAEPPRASAPPMPKAVAPSALGSGLKAHDQSRFLDVRMMAGCDADRRSGTGVQWGRTLSVCSKGQTGHRVQRCPPRIEPDPASLLGGQDLIICRAMAGVPSLARQLDARPAGWSARC